MGGLPRRRELERVTDIVSNSSSSHVREPSAPSLLPRTIVWKYWKEKKIYVQLTKRPKHSKLVRIITVCLWLYGYKISIQCQFNCTQRQNHSTKCLLTSVSKDNSSFRSFSSANSLSVIWAYPTLRGSTVVMTVTSMKGLGLFAVSSMSDCHCRGNPTNFCSCSSKSVCTRCSKLDGAEIWMRDFFFLVNMMAAEAATAKHQTCREEAGERWELAGKTAEKNANVKLASDICKTQRTCLHTSMQTGRESNFRKWQMTVFISGNITALHIY